MPKIKVNGISMYYELHGEGEPIILISGFGADHLMWDEVVSILKNNYTVIVFDNRGAGQTDIPKKLYTIDEMSRDTAQLCHQLNIKKAHFIGNSMGGFILQHLAYHYPELVQTAMISNSATSIQCSFHLYLEAQLELRKANAPLSSLIKASSSWAFSYKFLTRPGMLENLIDLGLNTPYPFSIAGYEGQYAAVCQFDSTDWVDKIKTPTLIVGGDQDLIFPEALIKMLASHIPHAKYYSFKDCGHLPLMEYPVQFAKLAKELISEHQIAFIDRLADA